VEYIQRVVGIWHAELLNSDAAKLIAGWCMEYYGKYNNAPNSHIQVIYYEKVKQGINKDIATDIEEILTSLSEESTHQEPVNVDYLVQQTIIYFNERLLSRHIENTQQLLDIGKIDDAAMLAAQFKPIVPVDDMDKHILTIKQIRSNNPKQPLMLMKPWLKEGQTTIIYGNYGSGKSLLCILTAYLLGLKEYDIKDAEIGEWFVKTQTGTLYIDGELGQKEMEERVAQFEWIGLQSPEYKLRVLSVPEYQLETEDEFQLRYRPNQLKLLKWLNEHPTYRLIILDSVSTLFGLEEENNNSEWNNRINPLLRDLRAMGVACILLHHAGKDGKRGLRGASAMGAIAHNIFRIKNHQQKVDDDGEAWLTITKDKQRAGGYSFKAFSMHFIQTPDGKETHWDLTDNV
jgi:RecA-family ATPase